jgi:hypothetical protein
LVLIKIEVEKIISACDKRQVNNYNYVGAQFHTLLSKFN